MAISLLRGILMKKLATAIAAIALIGTPVLAADMAVKAPPPPPAPVPGWTGFYGGIQFGGGWSDEAVNYSPNDPASAKIFNGKASFSGNQPLATSYRIPQSSLVGGFEAGYNWQVVSNWLLGLEADFSFSDINGQASNTSVFTTSLGGITQSTFATQDNDWYGTVRGRLGWLATPNVLLFGTGGFAYGRVAGSANYLLNSATSIGIVGGGFAAICTVDPTCFTGSSSAISTGWTAGGGAEWLLDQHWSAKIEYLFVDLGTETVRINANPLPPAASPLLPASFNAAFRDQFNVVRLGLNYHF
jgi:outer membrane immunogenic protein